MSLKSICMVVGASLFVAGCGGSGSSVDTSDVSIRFSDAPVESAEQVVIKVDQIIFRQEGGEEIVVDTFTSDELGIEDADTFEIDLLEVQGNDNRLVLDSVELPVGGYQDLRIVVLDEDVNDSYVKEVDTDTLKAIKVPSDSLKLGAFEVAAESTQTFVIEFGLRQAMTYNPGPDRYILKPRGVRIVRLEDASSISGTVDLSEIHLDAACSVKPDSTIGNVAYLYEGHGLDTSLLGDVFVRSGEGDDAEVDEDVPENIIAPAVATAIDGDTGAFFFSYLLPGDYTLAMSCNAELDDPVMYDGIAIPEPESVILELNLAPETDLACNFPNVDGCEEIELPEQEEEEI